MSRFDWQTIAVAAAVLWAAGTLIRRGSALWRNTGSGCASGGCGTCAQSPQVTIKPLVSLSSFESPSSPADLPVVPAPEPASRH